MSHSPEYYSVYGSDYPYTDAPLLIKTTVGYDSWKNTLYRDFFILFRMQSMPDGNTTDLAENFGYQCKIITDAGDDQAVLRLLEEKTNGKEAVMGKSSSFDFYADQFYEMRLFAFGKNFWCSISDGTTVLANVTAVDNSYTTGYVAIADEPSDYGPHYWSELDVEGTVVAPTAKPVAVPVPSPYPTPRPTRKNERQTDDDDDATVAPTPRPTKRNERKTDDDDGSEPEPTSKPTRRNQGSPP